MNCNVISTGSREGNAVLLNGYILFDCGVPFYRLEPYLKDIQIIMLTHVHSDHFNIITIKRVHKRRPSIRFVCSRNMIVQLVSRCGVPPRNIILVNPEDHPREIPGAFGDTVEISTFNLIHDVENIGYLIAINGFDGGTAMYCTDTHHIPISAPSLDLYMIEANYRKEEIESRIRNKAEANEFFYESRVMESHMSMESAIDWLSDNADALKSKIVFLHGHAEKECEANNGTTDTIYAV